MLKIYALMILFFSSVLHAEVYQSIRCGKKISGDEKAYSVTSVFELLNGEYSSACFSSSKSQAEKKSRLSWSVRTGSNDGFSAVAGFFHAKFGKGMILSSSETNPFSRRGGFAGSVFSQERRGDRSGSMRGFSLKYNEDYPDGQSIFCGAFVSQKFGGMSLSEEQAEETKESFTSIFSAKEQASADVLLCGAFTGVRLFDVFSVQGAGLRADLSPGKKIEMREPFKMNHYAASSFSCAFGNESSEIFFEAAISSSEESTKESLSYISGIRFSSYMWEMKILRRNLSDDIYLPYSFPFGGKTPGIINLISLEMQLSSKVSAFGEIKQIERCFEGNEGCFRAEENACVEYRESECFLFRQSLGRKLPLAKERASSGCLNSFAGFYFIENVTCEIQRYLCGEYVKYGLNCDMKILKNVFLSLGYVNMDGSHSFYNRRHNSEAGIKYCGGRSSLFFRYRMNFDAGMKNRQHCGEFGFSAFY